MRSWRRRARLGALAGLVLGLAACSDEATRPGQLQGDTWTLLAFQRADGTSVALPPDATFAARFGDDGRLNVQADCNVCGGAWEAEAAALRVTPLACTRAFCSSAPVDTDFVAALQGAREYEAGARLLTVRGAGLLVFQR